MRPHANDLDRALELPAVDGDGRGIDGVDKAMLQGDASRVEPFEAADRALKGGRRRKRVGTISTSCLPFFSSPAALSFSASLAACLVKTTCHMLTTPGSSRQRTPRWGRRGRR